MYKCEECGWVFEFPKRVFIKDECFGRIYTDEIETCPECGSENFEEYDELEEFEEELEEEYA